MNQMDAVVTKVLSEPKQYAFSEKYWFVEVEYDCWGSLSKTEIMTTSKELAEAVVVGHKFLV